MSVEPNEAVQRMTAGGCLLPCRMFAAAAIADFDRSPDANAS
jgi:hypothetical protein